MELKTWTIHFVKARDAFYGNLIKIDDLGDSIKCVYKNKTSVFVISPVLSILDSGEVTVVCYNSERNISFLINNWSSFLKPGLFILFVNPDLNRYWSINPIVHDKVADKRNLKNGLWALTADIPLV